MFWVFLKSVKGARPCLARLLEQLGLGGCQRLGFPLLSGGEQRRVESRARQQILKFLLLDEPFSGIDPIQVLELQRIIFELKRSDIGILMTDHNVRETLMVTDRAYIINNGNKQDGPDLTHWADRK